MPVQASPPEPKPEPTYDCAQGRHKWQWVGERFGADVYWCPLCEAEDED
jgi:hypothetical protein